MLLSFDYLLAFLFATVSFFMCVLVAAVLGAQLLGVKE